VGDVAISVRGLWKSYGEIEAVRGIALRVEPGEVFALLGPNGAGKTTTVEILEGYRHRSAGEVSVLGHDPARHERELRERIGIVLQSTGIDPYLTARETVLLYSGYYPRQRDVDEVLQIVGLTEKRDARVIKLSGGQQRRLDVAIALAGDPELLFLDEPTTGFDPGARRQAWEVVRNLAALGKTVFLGRFIPVVRSVGFIIAGVAHMPWKRFFVYDVAGALIWGVGHSVLGYALGASYERWERYATPAGLVLLVVLLFLIGGSKLLAARRRVKEEIEEIREELEEERELLGERNED